MKINEILNEKYSLTAECNNIARFHTHEYYQFLLSTGAINHHQKAVLPYDAAAWAHSCNLNASFIEDKESNFYVVANNVSIEYSIEEINNVPTTYQDYMHKSRPGIKAYSAHFDSDNSVIKVAIDPMLLDEREKHLQFIIYRILMHEISHVFHYSRTLTNFKLGGSMPEQNKKYHVRSYEIDARYRDGWTQVYYIESRQKKKLTTDEAWTLIQDSITRNGAYKISPSVLSKYKKQFYQDYKEHLGRSQ